MIQLKSKRLYVDNVFLLLLCRREPTKTKWGWIEETATGIIRKARISKLSNVEIPKPEPPQRVRKTGPFDTPANLVHEQSFIPNLKSSPIPEDCQL